MKRFICFMAMVVLLAGSLMPISGSAEASGTLQIITPEAAGTASGSLFFPMERAFDSPDIDLDAGTNEPIGGPGAYDAPYYSDRVGYIDLGADWAEVRITSSWTKYRASSLGNQTPYTEVWWDDDTDSTNDSGLTETQINFNTAQGLSTGSTKPWIRDVDVSGSPVIPEARYLMLRSPSNMTNRASEYAIVGLNDQGSSGNEPLQVITPTVAGVASGSLYFPLQNAFDGQPQLDVNTGDPTGGSGANDAPAYGDRGGYIDFGPDWSKVRITSAWTQYRPSSNGDQSPYQQLWWDDDTDMTNDSGLTETELNFNSAQNLSTGSATPWIIDSDASMNPIEPQARYLLLRSPATMTNRAKEYAFIGWIDVNGNGVQDAPFVPVSQIDISTDRGLNSVLVNETLKLSAAVLPYTATNRSVTWSVENGTGSATISASGLLTALSEGTVTVKATAQDGSNVVGSTVIDISQYRSFILPVEGLSAFSYIDVQASFPEVDWQTLERLYIPAGTYEYARLANLPERTAENPLIITNYGGQVKVAGTYNYVLSLGGGSHWILTGEYDSELKTGHPDYLGHADGDYANSAGQYGIEIGRSRESGIMIGSFATNFELSYIEVAHAGFAGLLIKTDNQPTATMDGVKLHDLYIHDAESEGMYIGNTGATDSQHLFTNLEIYNNRVLRSGTEGIQLTNMGDGLNVHHNVVAMCALDWKDPFQMWQDGCFQYSQRSGSAEIHHNVFIGGASKTMEFGLTSATGESLEPNDEVWIHDNYFSHGRNLFSYIHNSAKNPSTSLRFEDNVIRQYNFHYDELPTAPSDPNKLIFANDNTLTSMTFANNVRDGIQTFIDTVGGDNGTVGNVTATGNTTSSSLAPIVFEDVTFAAGFDWTRIEIWDDYSDLYAGPIYYNQGDYVYYYPTGELYLCIEVGAHTGKDPTTNPSTWQLVSPMNDDFRLDANSPYQGFGLLD